MSADFRLRDMNMYAQWYGHEHRAPKLQGEAVYGLTEFYREKIAAARLVACPGCYPTAALLALVPLAKAKLIDVDDIVIDAKSGVTGAGRGLKQNTLFSEAGEGLSPYSVGTHRHAPEIEQEIGVAAGSAVTVNFTPHLIPMSRGELCTSYVKLNGASADDLRAALVAGLQGRTVRACREEGRAAADPERARFELRADRRVRRPHQEPRHRDFGARQSGEGLGRAGDPEHEPDVRASGSRRAGADRAVSVRRGTAVDEDTLQFYRSNAQAYAGREITSRQAQLNRFLLLLQPGAAILELGCGAGGNSAEILARGFDLSPTDGSPEMAEVASRRLGRPVETLLFHDLDEVEAYDGVWANACLLHVPRPELAQVLTLIWRALKSGGQFYASFKAGEEGGRDTLNRYYNYPSPEWLRDTYASAGSWMSLAIEKGEVRGFDGERAEMLFVLARKSLVMNAVE